MNPSAILTAQVPVRVEEISSLQPFESLDMGSCYTIVVRNKDLGLSFAGHLPTKDLAKYINVWPQEWSCCTLARRMSEGRSPRCPICSKDLLQGPQAPSGSTIGRQGDR